LESALHCLPGLREQAVSEGDVPRAPLRQLERVRAAREQLPVTAEEVATLVQRISAMWPNWRLPTADDAFAVLVEEWTLQLERADRGHALAAARQFQSDGLEWPPGPGRLNRAALALSGVVFPPDASEAWGEVEDTIRYVGRYGKPHWSHEAVREAVSRMGGFWSLCESEDGMADRAHFLKTIYPPIAKQHEREAVAPVPVLPSPVAPVAALEPATAEPLYRYGRREADLIAKDVP